MTVHPYGGVRSPSCANYALKKTATDNTDKALVSTIDAINKSFYVDDCLCSSKTEEEAIKLA